MIRMVRLQDAGVPDEISVMGLYKPTAETKLVQ